MRRKVKQKKKFDGKIFSYVGTFPNPNCRFAEAEAESYRKRGFYARVDKRRWGCLLYVRKK